MTTKIELAHTCKPEIDGDPRIDICITAGDIHIRKDRDHLMICHAEMREMIEAWNAYHVAVKAAAPEQIQPIIREYAGKQD